MMWAEARVLSGCHICALELELCLQDYSYRPYRHVVFSSVSRVPIMHWEDIPGGRQGGVCPELSLIMFVHLEQADGR